jgi:hypothetical protein
MGGGRGGGDRPAPQIPDVAEETLILSTPDKWYPYSRETDALVETYMFPTGQEPSDWEEALRQEVYLTTAGVTAPRQVFELRSKADSERCTNFESNTLSEQPDNGYPVFFWRQVCDTGDDVDARLSKVILGEDQLYVVSKVWRYEPRDRDWARWDEFLQRVYVCDPVRPGHRCRPGGLAPGQAGRGGMGR